MAWTNPSPAQLAKDFIASQREPPDADAGALAQFLFFDFSQSEPNLTWETILLVVSAYPLADYYAGERTEAQVVGGVLAAGPIEDLLSFHGTRFIERFEEEAKRDRRMAWALGGVWQFMMPDDVWSRVQSAADYSHRGRPVAE